LRADELIAKAEVAGPGFINITLKPSAWIGAWLVNPVTPPGMTVTTLPFIVVVMPVTAEPATVSLNTNK